MHYFGNKSVVKPAPKSPFVSYLMTKKCAKDNPIEHFWLIQMLDNFRSKRNLFYDFLGRRFL